MGDAPDNPDLPGSAGGSAPGEGSVRLACLPRPLDWLVPSPAAGVTRSGVLRLAAGPRTDWYIDPAGGAVVRNAPALVMPASGPWQCWATVSAEHRATFDAGVMFVHVDDERWAKLCLERSPQGEVMIVSVVTRGRSDDCDAVPVGRRRVHLRVAALERSFAFHWSRDGQVWRLVRSFWLGDDAPSVASVGFMTQSPTGDGCVAEFRDVGFSASLLDDLRSGA